MMYMMYKFFFYHFEKMMSKIQSKIDFLFIYPRSGVGKGVLLTINGNNPPPSGRKQNLVASLTPNYPKFLCLSGRDKTLKVDLILILSFPNF